MKARVYLETTIPSYLTAWPSRDLIQAAHQQLTREWWEKRREQFELFISQVVLRECQAGDPTAAAARLEILQGLPLPEQTDEATKLAQALLQEVPLPERAAVDALHIAVAAVHGMEYLLTWNCAYCERGVPQPDRIRLPNSRLRAAGNLHTRRIVIAGGRLNMDDILLEIRRIREDYAKQFGYDLLAIHRDLKQQEQTCGRRIVSLPPRRPSPQRCAESAR